MRTLPRHRQHPQKHYPERLELEISALGQNSALWWLYTMVGRRKDVLDVGCATGYLARLLSSNDCNVSGIDVNAEAAEAAGAYCSRVFVADLDFTEIGDAVEGKSFDVVVFGDILEHLRQPALVLDRTRALLRADGYVVASIPNVAHGAVRLALIGGGFDYSQLGILDDSHLRFFTLKTAEELFLEAGYRIRRVERTKLPLFENSNLVPTIERSAFSEETIAHVMADPECETLQFIVEAEPLSDDERLQEISRRFVEANTSLARAQSRIEQLERNLEETRQHLATADVEMVRAQESYRDLQAQGGDSGEAHALELDLVRAQERLGAETVRIVELRGRYDAEIGALNGTVADLRTGARVLEDAIERFGREAESLRGEIAGLRSENAALRNENAGLLSEDAGLRSEDARLRSEIAGLGNEIAGQRIEIAGQRNEIAGLRSENGVVQDEIIGLRGANDTLRGELLAEQERLQLAETRHDEEVKSVEKTAAALATELAAARTSVVAEIARLGSIELELQVERKRSAMLVDQTNATSDRTRREVYQLYSLIDSAQSSPFWSFKRFLDGLFGRKGGTSPEVAPLPLEPIGCDDPRCPSRSRQ